jgi:hypothetical protein
MITLTKYITKYVFIEWTPLNEITLGQTITDPNNRMITINEYISYTKCAIERLMGFDQTGSV